MSNQNKNIIKKKVDTEMLQALYKFSFMTEEQLAVVIGEQPSYAKGRLKKLASAGYIKRTILNGKAANYITKEGMRMAGLKYRNVNPPTLSKYAHSFGFAEICVWLSLRRKMKDGSLRGYVDLGQINTERDFCSVRELHMTGSRSDGQPIYVSADKGIHSPDGFFRRPDGAYTCIEYERTMKPSIFILRKNIFQNMKRFRLQIWVSGDPYILKTLNMIRKEVGENKMAVYDLKKIIFEIDRYISNIPVVISEKSGIPRHSCLGSMATPIPLNHLPLLPEYREKVQFETRKNAETSCAETANMAGATEQGSGKPLFERR